MLAQPPAWLPAVDLPLVHSPASALFLQEFEIELEGSQTLRILCYEKCYNKTKLPKEDGETMDRIMGKGQIQVGSCTLFFEDGVWGGGRRN